MADVTGNPSNPPIEYRAAPVEAAPQQAVWPATQTAAAAEDIATAPMVKQILSEFIGTFALVFVAVTTLYWFAVDFIAIALASALVVALMVGVFARFGSGQFNPAITLGLVLGGRLKFSRAAIIIPVQLVAAVLASLMLVNFLGQTENLQWRYPKVAAAEPGVAAGALAPQGGQPEFGLLAPVEAGTPRIPERVEIPEPIGRAQPRPIPGSQRVTILQAIVLEAVLTFFWGMAAFAGLRRGAHPLLGPVLIGAAVAVGILTAGILTGGAMNPARAFGPALASGAWANQMVYWIGPMIGGALAGVICGHFLFNDEEESSDAPAYPAT
ncbi:MAG: aquaporin [Verrucomicrobia subdivision 3 bacterium]|nr:aquaporin [Limisphaerales bacterium]